MLRKARAFPLLCDDRWPLIAIVGRIALLGITIQHLRKQDAPARAHVEKLRSTKEVYSQLAEAQNISFGHPKAVCILYMVVVKPVASTTAAHGSLLTNQMSPAAPGVHLQPSERQNHNRRKRQQLL